MTSKLAKDDRVAPNNFSQCVDRGECFQAVKDSKIDEGSILELGNTITNFRY